MPRLSRVHSFLDRFEQRLQVDCEQLKRQLLAQVDQQFGAVREKVAELRSRFGGTRPGTVNIDPWIDDPSVETVALELCVERHDTQLELSDQVRDVPSTSTGRKRKSTNQTDNKQKKIRYDGSKRHVCKFLECGKSFPDDFKLAEHERIHLGIKPFFCTWPDCKYSSQQRSRVVTHIRVVHFKLPETVKKQNELNIIDDRDPNEFVRVDQQLASRRL